MTYSSKQEILNLGNIHPEFESYLQNHPQPTHSQTLAERKLLSQQNTASLCERLAKVNDGVKKTELSFETDDASSIAILLYQPEVRPQEGSPLIVMFHGGGFCVGAAGSEEISCRNFARELGAVCVSVGYRLAPEHKFPTAPDDAWVALKFAAASAAVWGADPAKGFIVGGTSAGGNLASVLAHKARDTGFSPPLTGQCLICPWLCPRTAMPERYQHLSFSYEQNRTAPMLNDEVLNMYEDAYLPDTKDDRFDVFNHSKGHQDLPPTYMMVCGMDPFRDEDLIYERILREECGIETKLDVYPGVPHSYWIFYPGFNSTSMKPREDIIEGVRWLLEQASSG